jgi:DNA invertase Pin-like site-specific DNA recombinase
MKNVIELIRVSTEQQAGDDRAGIPAQRDANRRAAKFYGLNIVQTFEIIDVSGTSVLMSPEMQELVRQMQSPDIHGVVTKEFSRLIRPEKFTDYALLQAFIDTKTILYLPDGPIDLASKSGRLLGTIRAAIAGLERREILDRMQDAKEAMRRAGKHPGGSTSLPYGVSYSAEHGWFYTAEAEKVKQAFAIFLSGQTSYTAIGQKLNIARTSLRFILENPIYTGWRVYNQKRDQSASGYVPGPNGRQGYRRKMGRAEDEVIRVRVLAPLVSEEEFRQVQEMIDLKRRRHWRVRAEAPNRYTYNGFLTCADCANPLYTHSSQYDFYLCKTRNTRESRKRAVEGLAPCQNRYMLRTKLEAKLDCLLGEKIRKRGFLSAVLDAHKVQSGKSSTYLGINQSAVIAKLTDLKEKKQRVLDAFFDGVIDKRERDRRLLLVQAEADSYQRLLLEGERFAQPLGLQDLEQVLEPFSEWEFLERDDKRALLSVICPEIKVFQYTVKSLVLSLGASSFALQGTARQRRDRELSVRARTGDARAAHPAGALPRRKERLCQLADAAKADPQALHHFAGRGKAARNRHPAPGIIGAGARPHPQSVAHDCRSAGCGSDRAEASE